MKMYAKKSSLEIVENKRASIMCMTTYSTLVPLEVQLLYPPSGLETPLIRTLNQPQKLLNDPPKKEILQIQDNTP